MITTIRPSEWGLSLTEFKKWSSERSVEIQRVKYDDPYPVDRVEEFYFSDDADLIVFRLSFHKTQPRDNGCYYCPYIPILSKDI